MKMQHASLKRILGSATSCLSRHAIGDLTTKIYIDIRVIRLGGLLVALVAILIGEYFALRSDKLEASDHRPLPVIPTATRPTVDVTGHGDLQAILERPMFSETRRPPPVVLSKAIELPRLTGVVISGSSRTAIFADNPDHKPIALTEGDSLGLYVVQAITEGQVTMSGPDGVRVLRPTFDINREDRLAGDQVNSAGGPQSAPAQVYKGPKLRSS